MIFSRRFVLIAMLILLTFGCKRQGDPTHKFILKDNLYIEFYKAGIIGNLTSMYIADSSKFRLYLGTYDPENEFIYVRIVSDSIVTEKKYTDRMYETRGKVIERKSYNLNYIIKNHGFD